MQYPENHPSAGGENLLWCPPGQPLGTRVNVRRAAGILIRQTFAPRRGGPQAGPPPAEQGLPLFLSCCVRKLALIVTLWAACNRGKIGPNSWSVIGENGAELPWPFPS